MSCPFYGKALYFDQAPVPESEPIHAALAWFPAARNNRCALITSAHSPCWMEVGEARAPSWPQCPRNPEFFATQIARSAQGPDRQEMKRLEDAAVSLSFLRTLRSKP
jgi:hypothetical protein